MQAKSNFLATYENPELKISAKLGGTLSNNLEKKRSAITELIEIILFLAQRGCPPRGHDDSGPLDIGTL